MHLDQPISLVDRCRINRFFERVLDKIPEFVLILRAVDGIVYCLDCFLVFRLQIREVARIVYIAFIVSLPLRFLIIFINCENYVI